MQPRKVMESTEFGKTEFEKKTFQKGLNIFIFVKNNFCYFCIFNKLLLNCVSFRISIN